MPPHDPTELLLHAPVGLLSMQLIQMGFKTRLIDYLSILLGPGAETVDDGWIDFRVIKTPKCLEKYRNIVRGCSLVVSTLLWSIPSSKTDFNNFGISFKFKSKSIRHPTHFILFSTHSGLLPFKNLMNL